MFDIFRSSIDREKYFIVTYFLKSSISLRDAAWNVAIGQATGNPNPGFKSNYETEELLEKHSCIILGKEEELKKTREGLVKIAFPLENIDFQTDGFSGLLSIVQGGQLDIASIISCHVKDIEFPKHIENSFLGPKYGISGIRNYTKSKNKLIPGAIIKPKIGMDLKILLEMTNKLVDSGICWIKEDECLLGNSLPLKVRVPAIAGLLKGTNVIYHFNITADPIHLLERAKLVHELGGNGIHFNIHCGIGSYHAVRQLNLPLFMHFQKSGDKNQTSKEHAFHIDWKVIAKLVSFAGVDTSHATMWGGYMTEPEEEVKEILQVFQKNNTLPALSCGMHPGLVKAIQRRFGNDLLLNCGGSIHGHPMGTNAGAKAMVQAVNDETDQLEYQTAIKKWGKID